MWRRCEFSHNLRHKSQLIHLRIHAHVGHHDSSFSADEFVLIAIANKNDDDASELKELLSEDYQTIVVAETDNIEALSEQCDLLILDANFTAGQGIDFLMEFLAIAYLPVLVLTPIDNQRFVIEAMRAGAFNYLVKTGDHLQLINHAVTEALKRFSEREEMKRTILALRERVKELESRSRGVEQPRPPTPEEQRKGILAEIISLVKRGEVNLPVYSPINTRFRELLKAQADLTDIANLLGQDSAVTSKLMSVANSSFYRTGSEAKTLEQALSRLGLITAKNYVEVITNRALYISSNPKYQTTLRELWEHGLACANAAYAIAVRLELGDPDELFTTAILHDVGKLFLVQVLSELDSRDAPIDELSGEDIDEFLYAHHGQFGSVLLRRWKLPDEFVRVAQHHEDVEKADPISKTLCVINCANVLVHQMSYGKAHGPEVDFAELFAAKLLKVGEPDRVEVQAEVQRLMSEIDVGLDA